MRIPSVYLISLFMVVLGSVSLGQSAEPQHDHAVDKHAQTISTPACSATESKPVLVHFPQAMREHTLANMRDHLSVLAEIQGYLATHRYDAAANIAEQRLGMSSLKLHGAHEVAKYMPQGMQAAGTVMHRAASQFALTAQEAAIDNDMGKSVAALATLTQICVACHAVYRLR